uniref:Uncharacterized protein n=1 Tax=Anopheles darlingi TaxID=43151 RepID=A0A2M4D8W9_ANODA
MFLQSLHRVAKFFFVFVFFYDLADHAYPPVLSTILPTQIFKLFVLLIKEFCYFFFGSFCFSCSPEWLQCLSRITPLVELIILLAVSIYITSITLK